MKQFDGYPLFDGANRCSGEHVIVMRSEAQILSVCADADGMPRVWTLATVEADPLPLVERTILKLRDAGLVDEAAVAGATFIGTICWADTMYHIWDAGENA